MITARLPVAGAFPGRPRFLSEQKMEAFSLIRNSDVAKRHRRVRLH